MKTIVIKGALLIPVIFFLAYLLLLAIGGITCAFSADAQLYCSTFCSVALMIMGIALLLIMGILARDIQKHRRTNAPLV